VQKAEPLADSSFEKPIKEEVSEIFEVEKDGKEKTIEAHATELEKAPSGEQLRKETKIFRNVVIVMVGFALMFATVYLIINSMRYFEIQGVKFEIVREGQLTLYKTSLPVMYQGQLTSYNFYFRNDPRTLKEKVPLTGNLIFRKNMVLDVTTQNLFCGGDWTIGLANFKNLYDILGINLLVKNKSAEYFPISDYMFVTINQGNKTEIKQMSSYTYYVNIANCEVLPAFERLMLESFIRNKKLNE
jgi:hypothetical protein